MGNHSYSHHHSLHDWQQLDSHGSYVATNINIGNQCEWLFELADKFCHRALEMNADHPQALEMFAYQLDNSSPEQATRICIWSRLSAPIPPLTVSQVMPRASWARPLWPSLSCSCQTSAEKEFARIISLALQTSNQPIDRRLYWKLLWCLWCPPASSNAPTKSSGR